jgi:HEAT repeat protein
MTSNTRATGGIYRVRYARNREVDRERPDLRSASVDQLADLLHDRSPALRDLARLELSKRGDPAVAALCRVLHDPSEPLAARQHCLWALGALTEESSRVPLRAALADPDPRIVVPAVRALAFKSDRGVSGDLCRLLTSESPSVRRAAAEALARCGDSDALSSVWKALSDDPDRFLEHALIYAAHRIADGQSLEDALVHPSPRVQKAALVLLDQPPQGKLSLGPVLRAMRSKDPSLRAAALGILRKNGDWGPYAVPLLKEWIWAKELDDPERSELRETVLAFQSDRIVQRLVASAISNGSISAECRVLLLDTISKISPDDVPGSWKRALLRVLRDPSSEMRRRAVTVVGFLRVSGFKGRLRAMAEDPDEPPEVRLEALRALIADEPVLGDRAFEFLLDMLGSRENPPGRLASVEILGRSCLKDTQVSRAIEAVRGDSIVSPRSLVLALRESAGTESALRLLDVLRQAIEEGWCPDLGELGEATQRLPSSVVERCQSLLRLAEDRVKGQWGRLRDYEPLLEGGNPELGREVFFGTRAGCSV